MSCIGIFNALLRRLLFTTDILWLSTVHVGNDISNHGGEWATDDLHERKKKRRPKSGDIKPSQPMQETSLAPA